MQILKAIYYTHKLCITTEQLKENKVLFCFLGGGQKLSQKYSITKFRQI